jgi:polyphenol oxidase
MATITGKRRASTPRRSAAADDRPPRGSSWTLRRAGTLRILEAPALAKLEWLVHGFSTRPGGLSGLEEASTAGKSERVSNLGFTDWDSRQHVIENRRKFSKALGAGKMRMVTLRQVHSDIPYLVDASNFALDQEPPRGDALFTRETGVLLAVQTADCIPILFADTRTRAVAAVHSGWRGTLSRIAEKTLGRMRMEFGSRPEDVIAALGPGIGGCCYEVGHEVAKEFAGQFPNARDWFEGPLDAMARGENDPNWLPWLTMMPPGHTPEPPSVHLDLVAANRAILAAAGVPPESISVSGFCTACRTDLFFSYRRERNTGRLMAVIGIL